MSDPLESSVDSEADVRVIDALLASLATKESEATEARIARVMVAMETEGIAPRSRDSVRRSGIGPAAGASRRRRSWRPIGGLGVGLAAMIAVVVWIIGKPETATAANWLARAEAAASEEASRLVGYLVEIVPHADAPDPRPVRGRLLVGPGEHGHPLVRFDVETPKERRHAVGIDRQGGWHQGAGRPLREFPPERLPRNLVFGELDFVVDPLVALLERVERDYEIVELEDGIEPRLRAVHRDSGPRHPRAPGEIEIVLDPDDWTLRRLVLRWGDSADRSIRPSSDGSRRNAHRPGRPRDRGREGVDRRRDPKREGPPPPFELKLERFDVDDSMSVDRDPR